MSEFEKSNWVKAEYSKKYLDNADNYIPERKTLLRILTSFYRNFIGIGGNKRILDLGCGDGILGKTLYDIDKQIEIVVTDGSEEMLNTARVNLSNVNVKEFRLTTFDEIIKGKFNWEPFDFIMSAFAIHHLELSQKKALFYRIIEALNSGAYFLNIDVALPANSQTEDWYYELWREWIDCHHKSLNIANPFEHVPNEARAKSENYYDPLQIQLDYLSDIGFVDVECHYKYGLFTIYGAKKP